MRNHFSVKMSITLLISLILTGCAVGPKTYKDITLDNMYPILSAEQYDTLKSLVSEKDVNNFLDNFWQEVDSTSGFAAGEFKSQYLERLTYANEHFPDRFGWGRSDRKKIYLLHGAPSYIEREECTNIHLDKFSTIKSLEIWLYMSPGENKSLPTRADNIYMLQKKFIFGDETGTGNYVLLYSSEDTGDIDVRMFE